LAGGSTWLLIYYFILFKPAEALKKALADCAKFDEHSTGQNKLCTGRMGTNKILEVSD